MRRLITFLLLSIWTSLVSAQWIQTNGLEGGQVSCFAVSGVNLFAGSPSGGIYLSTNDGSNWTAVNSGLPSLYIEDLVVNGSNLFAATHRDGVFLSSNNGASWTAVNSGLTFPATAVRALAVSGSNLFAGTEGGVFLSTNNGSSWTAVNSGLTSTSVRALAISGSNLFAGTAGNGVFLSTDNGGSWTAVNSGLTSWSILALTVNGSNLFAGTHGGVFLSTDNGSNWTAVNSGLTNTTILALAVNGSNLFAGTAGGVFLSSDNGSNWTAVNSGLMNTSVSAFAVSGSNLFAGTGGGVFLSSDNGLNWTAVNSGLMNVYVHALAVNGSNLFAGTSSNGVFLSTNNGSTWIAVNSGLTSLGVECLVVSGANLFVGTVGDGVFLSTNNGSSWAAVNSGMTNTTVQALAVNGSNLLAGTATNGVFLSTNNGLSWTAVNSGLTNTTVLALAVSGSNLFAGTGGGVFLSSDNGSSWTAVNSGLTSLVIYALTSSGSDLFAGTMNAGVFLSTNSGTSWTAVNSGLPPTTNVYDFAVSGSNLFVGTIGGGVFLSTNNGNSWAAVNSGLTTSNSVVALASSGTKLFAGTTGNGLWQRPLSELVSPLAAGTRSTFITSGSIRLLNSPQISSALTLEAWVYPMTMYETDAVILRRFTQNLADPFYTYSLHLHRNSSTELPTAVFSISNGVPGNGISLNSNQTTIPFFKWTHVAATYDGSSMKVYINGKVANQTSASVTIPAGGEMRIGVSIAPVTSTSRFFGFVDEVRHWSTVRSQAEIQGAMNGLDYPATLPGLIGYWKFEEASGTTAYDASAQGNSGEYRNGASTVPFSPFDLPATPTLSVLTPSVDIGILEQGESVARQISIRNDGTGTLVGYFSPQAGIQGGSEGYAVAAGATFNTGVAISPASIGMINTSMKFISNDTKSTAQIPVTGVGLQLQKLDVNNVSVYFSRNGRIGRSPTGENGFEWPKGSGKSPVYQAGLWVSAQVGADIRTAGAYYTSEYQAGPVVGGSAPDPSNSAYRVYKISEGDFSASNPDFGQWPASWGAPANNDGTPRLLGGETLFAVYNDMNTIPHMQGNAFRTQPLGCEVQQTVYGFTSTNSLKNTVFIKYKLVNQSNGVWTNAYASFWSDPDIGDARDDLAGCDPGRNLGYAYNGSSVDATYNSTPPAVGYVYLEGTTPGMPMSAFSYFASGGLPQMSDPTTGAQVYNYARGFDRDGNPRSDPTLGSATRFPMSGDPVTGTGWVDQNPADRRVVISSGPFNLAPGESKEIVFAVVIGQGTGNLNSVSVLKNSVDEIRSAYPGFPVYSSPTQLSLKSYLQTPAAEDHIFRGITTNRAGTLVYICDSQTDVVYIYKNDQSNTPIGSFGDPSWQVDMLGPYGIGTSDDDVLYIAVANNIAGHSLWSCNADGSSLTRLCGLPDFPRDLHVVGGGGNTVVYISGSTGNVIRWTPSGGAQILFGTGITLNQQDVVPNASQSALYVSSWTRILDPGNSPYDSPVTKWDLSGTMDTRFSTSYVLAGNVPGVSPDHSGKALYLLHIGAFAGYPGDAHIYKVDASTGAQMSSITLGPGGTLAGGGIHVSAQGEIFFSRTFGSVNGHTLSVWGKVTDPAVVIPPEFQAPAGYVVETYLSNLDKPIGLAFDNNRLLYVVESGTNSVYRYANRTSRALVASGFEQVADIIIDRGYLYISDLGSSGNGKIYRISLSALPRVVSAQDVLVENLNGPTFLQVNASGELFVSLSAGTSGDKIVKIPPTLPQPVVSFASDADPRGIVFASTGELYCVVQSSGRILKTPPAPLGIAGETLPCVLEGLETPAGVAIGSDDRLYVATKDYVVVSRRDSKAWSPFIGGLSGGPLNNIEYAGNGEFYIADYLGGRIIRVALPKSQTSPSQFPLVYKINEVGHPSVTDSTAFTAIRNAFQHWTDVSTCSASFQDGGFTASRYASMTDGVNLVTFTDDQFPFPPGVLAVAAKTLQMDPGQQTATIVDADIVFNPEFVRKTTWGLSTDTYPGIPDSLTFDIESIATHEIGHILGLVHSGSPTSAMFFILQPQKNGRTLQPDDIAWASYQYPDGNFNSAYGSIEGRVNYQSDQGTPVAGALLIARNYSTGSYYHSYSDVSGNYHIPGLPPGNYHILLRALNGRVFGYPMTSANVSAYLYAITSITDYPGEWWNQSESATDNPHDSTLVAVVAGAPTRNINLITNTDIVGPSVVSVSPVNSAQQADVFSPLVITFSEAVQTETINTGTVRLSGPSGQVGGTYLLINDNKTVVFTPLSPLTGTSLYTVSVTGGVTDLKKNPLSPAFTSMFTTGQSDLTPPAVAQVVPAKNATGVFVSSPVYVRFSKRMNPTTVNSSTFFVDRGIGSSKATGSITVTEDNAVATFTPSQSLEEGATYTIHTNAQITDALGNALGADYTSSFVTVSGPPSVIATGPAEGSSGISVTSPILVDFSKSIDPGTVNAQSIAFTVGGSPVAGTFEFLKDNSRVVFRPSAPLLFGTTYRVDISKDIQDLLHNQLTEDKHFTFMTAVLLQIPLITSIDPPAAPPGTTVVIAGCGFDPNPAKNTVSFNGIIAGASSSSSGNITTVVPDGVGIGLVNVTVTVGQGSVPYLFDVLIPLLNPQDNIIAQAPTGSQPKNSDVTPDGQLAFVTNFASGTVSVIGLGSTQPAISTIPVGTNPLGIVVTPDKSRVYVTNYGSNTVSVIDINNLSVIKTIAVGMNPMGIDITPDGSRIYVANSGSNSLSVIDGDSKSGAYNQIIAGSSTQSSPRDVTVSPDGTLAFVTGGKSLLIIDINPGSASYNQIIGQASTNSETKSVAVTPDGTLAIVTTKDGSILAISVYPKSPSFGQIIAGASTTSGANQPAPSPDGTRVYVTSPATNSVLVYDISYTAGVPAGTVSGIVTTGIALRLSHTIQVGTAPDGIVIDPHNQKVLVVNSGSSNVTIIRVAGVNEVAFQTLGQLNGEIQTLLDKPGTPKQTTDHLKAAQSALKTSAGMIQGGDVTHAFDQFRQAAHELKLASSSAVNVSEIISSVDQVADKLVQDAIKAAKALPASTDVNKMIADAEAAVQKAEAYVRGGDAENAMTSYKNAWDKAQLAVKLAQQAKGSGGKSQGQNEEVTQNPTELALGQNYPNPFNSTTQILFDIPISVAGGLPVELRIYNLLGQVVRTLVNDVRSPGRYIIRWDGRGENGKSLASGMYIVLFKAGEYRQAKRILLMQ